MCGIQCYAAILLALCFEVINGQCTFPGTPVGMTVVPRTNKATYSNGDLLLYQCDGLAASHVTRFCQGNTWSAPNRRCGDNFLWNNGALAGVMVAATNYVVAIFAVVYSKCRSKKSDEKESSKEAVTSNGIA